MWCGASEWTLYSTGQIPSSEHFRYGRCGSTTVDAMSCQSGAKVLVVDRELTRAERIVSMIAAGGRSCCGLLRRDSSAQCAAMVEDTVPRCGRLDCLDNNVGSGGASA
jgi:NAD(P)-dependent dehydrogenase (short-subunit alcohol dehydrogenase family)